MKCAKLNTQSLLSLVIGISLLLVTTAPNLVQAATAAEKNAQTIDALEQYVTALQAIAVDTQECPSSMWSAGGGSVNLRGKTVFRVNINGTFYNRDNITNPTDPDVKAAHRRVRRALKSELGVNKLPRPAGFRAKIRPIYANSGQPDKAKFAGISYVCHPPSDLANYGLPINSTYTTALLIFYLKGDAMTCSGAYPGAIDYETEYNFKPIYKNRMCLLNLSTQIFPPEVLGD
jgi:type II secretory pathway pseudopilin PulG